jgi:hypothetical protein
MSGNLIVQLGVATETSIVSGTNAIPGMSSRTSSAGAVYEAKFILPWSFSEEFAAERLTSGASFGSDRGA